MRIILLGPPGSGKGTQAKFIADRYKILQISIGEILRNAIQEDSNLKLIAKKFMNFGKLMPDKFIINIIKNFFDKNCCYNHFLLDGFPRTMEQVISMKSINIKVDIVIILILSKSLVIERITGRRIHSSSGRIYHMMFNPPKCNGYDDYTGEKLSIRKDDQKKAVSKRLAEYTKYTVPVIKYFSQEAIIGNIHYYSIDGNRSINDINKELMNILDKKFFN